MNVISMAKNNISRLLSSKTPFFTLSSLEALLGISRDSMRTTATRLAKAGILTRIRRDLYAIQGRPYSLFSLANALCQPSVISLETALNYWGIIVQAPQIIFSVGLRSCRHKAEGIDFVYRRIEPSLIRFGQVKADDFWITQPEKAFLDALYMKAKGLVELLPEDVDYSRLDHELVEYYSRLYPETVRKQLPIYRKHEYEAK